MPNDWFTPLLYLVAGALVLLAVQRLARLVRRGTPPTREAELPHERRLDFTARVLDPIRQDPLPERYWALDKLTARETEIARLVARGKHNAEVARELQISPYTVETHLKHIYTKLQVSSRTELALVVRELVD